MTLLSVYTDILHRIKDAICHEHQTVSSLGIWKPAAHCCVTVKGNCFKGSVF